MTDNKLLRGILIVLVLIGLGAAGRALWGEPNRELLPGKH